MRVQLDGCVPRRLAAALVGHDVVEAPGVDPGDEALLERARSEGRVLVTTDKDFGELVFRQGSPSHGVVRIAADVAPRDYAARVAAVLAAHEADLLAGAFVVVERDRVRIRRA